MRYIEKKKLILITAFVQLNIQENERESYFAVFISNELQCIPLWSQKAATERYDTFEMRIEVEVPLTF